ncbi:MAG: glycerate kinase [Methanobacteriota archaeon]|nr:MAG: glycerate kinase [Euryarchaeota archaeon]
MTIQNRDGLIEMGAGENEREARRTAIDVLEAVLSEADPFSVVRGSVRLEEDLLHVQGDVFDLGDVEEVYVIGGGKACGGMAEAIEETLGSRITEGLVNIPAGTAERYHTKRISLNEARHPIPDEQGIAGAGRMLEIAGEAGERDLVIILISGGGSALMTLPPEDIPLQEVQEVTRSLLKSGASIDEVNAVRKHLSLIKGGRLAEACHPARVIGLIISDVVGDPLDVIASGPTVPDTSTFEDALAVIGRYGMTRQAPAVTGHLERGVKGMVEETLKPGSPVFDRVSNYLLCSNGVVLDRVKSRLSRCFDVTILTKRLEGEARDAGRMLAARLMKERASKKRPLSRPCVMLAGGETTVTVRGDGRGGRNQELVLAALTVLEAEGVALASIGTDGVDGFTDAAGAMIDGKSRETALQMGLSPDGYLRRNDSYNFFKKLGGLLMTGPTGTNVNDVCVMVLV